MNNIIITIKYNIMSAAEGCKISFKIDYTSSAIKTAIALQSPRDTNEG
jgi:hypothetical protein